MMFETLLVLIGASEIGRRLGRRKGGKHDKKSHDKIP
jgi:hypothetical protein